MFSFLKFLTSGKKKEASQEGVWKNHPDGYCEFFPDENPRPTRLRPGAQLLHASFWDRTLELDVKARHLQDEIATHYKDTLRAGVYMKMSLDEFIFYNTRPRKLRIDDEKLKQELIKELMDADPKLSEASAERRCHNYGRDRYVPEGIRPLNVIQAAGRFKAEVPRANKSWKRWEEDTDSETNEYGFGLIGKKPVDNLKYDPAGWVKLQRKEDSNTHKDSFGSNIGVSKY